MMRRFKDRMREQQIRYKTNSLKIKEMGKSARGNEHPHLLPSAKWKYNLWEGIREEAPTYFRVESIAWHRQRHNLLSSQIMCVNLFYPLMKQLFVVKHWLKGEYPDIDKVIKLDFEYIGPSNYFNEQGVRGQNRTSSDIAITWRDNSERKNLLLLEFKFTEPDFGNCSTQGNTNPSNCLSSSDVIASPQTKCYRAREKKRHYWDYILSNNSPFLRNSLGRATYCPFRYDFYQLMRNQLLAHCIEVDSKSDFHRVEFGVVYHADNYELLNMTHPFGEERNPLQTWPSMLKDPKSFHVFTVQDFINEIEEIIPTNLSPWRSYLKERYDL